MFWQQRFPFLNHFWNFLSGAWLLEDQSCLLLLRFWIEFKWYCQITPMLKNLKGHQLEQRTRATVCIYIKIKDSRLEKKYLPVPL